MIPSALHYEQDKRGRFVGLQGSSALSESEVLDGAPDHFSSLCILNIAYLYTEKILVMLITSCRCCCSPVYLILVYPA